MISLWGRSWNFQWCWPLLENIAMWLGACTYSSLLQTTKSKRTLRKRQLDMASLCCMEFRVESLMRRWHHSRIFNVLSFSPVTFTQRHTACSPGTKQHTHTHTAWQDNICKQCQPECAVMTYIGQLVTSAPSNHTVKLLSCKCFHCRKEQEILTDKSGFLF